LINLLLAKMRVTGTGMGTGTKSVTHEGMGMSMSIFSNRGYEDVDYSTLPIPHPLPSLNRKVEIFSLKLVQLICEKF
jgi:hypothetical protein